MYTPTMYDTLDTVIIKHPKDAFISQEHLNNNWEIFNYIDVPEFESAIVEFEEFVDILAKHTRKIEYLPFNDETGLDSIYTHDAVKFIQNGAIILRSGKKLRQSEADVYKEFLKEKEIPILGELIGNATADGGDIVWIDSKTLAIGNGYRTNEEAFQQISKIVSPFADEVIEVQLPHDRGEEECLHLMSFLSIVAEKLAVIYSPLMPVKLRKMLIDKGFKFIEVPEEEYLSLGCNVLALSSESCMMLEGNPVTQQQLEIHGLNVFTYKGKEISYKGTGGPTCLTCPVIRK